MKVHLYASAFCPSAPKQASSGLWQAAKQQGGHDVRTDGPDDASGGRRRSIAAVALSGAAAPQLPPEPPNRRKAPAGAGGTPELPPEVMRAEAANGGGCATASGLGDEPHAAGARAALDVSGAAVGRLLQVTEISRQHEATLQPEPRAVQSPAAAASAADAVTVPPPGVQSTPAVVAAGGQQPVAQTAPDGMGSRCDHVIAHDDGEGNDSGAESSAPSCGNPGDCEAGQPSSSRTDRKPPLNAGWHRATRAVKDIGAEPIAQPEQAPSPGDDLPGPSAEAAAAAAAVGSESDRCPPSIAAALGAAGAPAEHQAGSELGTAPTLSPSRKPQKRVHHCNFCAIHGVVSVASRAHTRVCHFATRCFCFPCAKLGIRNRSHGEARQRRLERRLPMPQYPDVLPPD